MAATATRTCSIDGCDREKVARGWCRAHYLRWHRHGEVLGGRPPAPEVCSIEGCDKPHKGRGWCSAHWSRWKRNGHPLATKATAEDYTAA